MSNTEIWYAAKWCGSEQYQVKISNRFAALENMMMMMMMMMIDDDDDCGRRIDGGSLRTVLQRIFGPKREEVTGGWRRLHNEELCNLYASPNIIWVIKSRRMR
jgi:hypothetical protein